MMNVWCSKLGRRLLSISNRRGLSTSTAAKFPIKNVTVIGSGLMGTGIAQVLNITCSLHYIYIKVSAHNGYNVILVDMSNELLQRAEQRIKGSMQRVAKKQFKDDPKVHVIN